MRITALGASGGIGRGAYTTSFLIDDRTLIDCGSGVGTLEVETLLSIDRVLLTHSHLDHCCMLPLLADAHASHGGTGIVVYTQQETADALKAHMFSGPIWPDYTRYPEPDKAFVRFEIIDVGDTVDIPDGIATVLPANHSIPGIGWLIEGPWRALAFTGDTGPCPAFWQWLTTVPSLTDVIAEISYMNEQSAISERFGHLTASLLAPLVGGLPPSTHLWISHLEPGSEDKMMAEIRATLPATLNIKRLTHGQVIEL
jgi:ribonuclease BN (tRNA processing enzyme)